MSVVDKEMGVVDKANGISTWDGLLGAALKPINASYDKAESTYRDAASKYKEALDGQVPLLQLMQQTMGQKREVDEGLERRKRSVGLLTDSLRTVGQLFSSAAGGNVVGYKPLDVESDIAKKRAELRAYNDGYDRMAFQSAMQDRQDALKGRLNGVNMDMKIGELQGQRGAAIVKASSDYAELVRKSQKDAKDDQYRKDKRIQNSGPGGGGFEKEYADLFTPGKYHKEKDARIHYADVYGQMLQLDPDNKTGVREMLGGDSGVTRPYVDLNRIAMVTKSLLRNPKFAGLARQYNSGGSSIHYQPKAVSEIQPKSDIKKKFGKQVK